MQSKAQFFISVSIASGYFLAACGNGITTIPAISSSLTPSTIPTLAPTATPAATPSPDEHFQEISRAWRVAYLDEAAGLRCVMYGDGSDKLCIDSGYGTGYADVLYRWSPAGTKVAVLVGTWTRDGDSLYQSATGIYIWELGKNFTAFHNEDRTFILQPAWSPDGTSLAYSNSESIFVKSLDGTVFYDITRFLTADSMYPDWSPDGKKIAFSSSRRIMEPPGSNVLYHNENHEIMVVAPDGSNPINLTEHPAKDIRPKWSPDGESIAFFSDRDGSYDLYVMQSDGSSSRKVAALGIPHNDLHFDTAASWTYYGMNTTWLPDGKHILFDDKLIDLETGTITTLQFPFNNQSASWLMPFQHQSIQPIPTPHCAVKWSHLYQGGHAVVTGDADAPPNRVRNSPNASTEVVSQLYPGTIVRVIEGPVCADGLVFWKVEHPSIPGGAGWTAEGDGKGTDYYLDVYRP